MTNKNEPPGEIEEKGNAKLTKLLTEFSKGINYIYIFFFFSIK